MTKYLCFQSSLYIFVLEYINSIINELGVKVFITDKSLPIYNINDIYIFINTIPDSFMNKNTKNVYVLNIEQLTRNNFKNYINSLTDKNIGIIDYSSENMNLIDNKDIYYLPYQYNDIEINKLKKFVDANTQKKYDAVFVGHLSPKRLYIFEKLKNMGLNMLHISSCWGDFRDQRIASAKILVNVHFDDNYNIYEVLRCDRWIFSKMLTVSETSMNCESLDIADMIIFEKYDSLVDKIVDIIKNYDTYYSNYLDTYEKNIENIKQNRKNDLIYLKEKLEAHIINKHMNIEQKQKQKLPDKTLELFSANWVCNFQKQSFVKIGTQYINLNRGFNVVGLKGNTLELLNYYDTCIEDFSLEIQKKLFDLYDKKEYDYLILITHDDAVHRTNPSILQNLLIFLGCKELKNLQFRASYLCIYDLKNRSMIHEICDNQFPIHEWFELKKKDNDTQFELENLGIPVYLIIYNLKYFVKNSVDQLKKFTKNIHIIDNKSTYPQLLEYYENEYDFFLEKMDANYGHLVWMRQMYWQFPRIFAISDPDLEYNPNLPADFLNIMKNLTYEYKKGKVGFALDLSDAELFFKDKGYCEGLSIEEWESRFWLRKIDNPTFDLYNASVDTTFCVVNKSFEERNNAIRMGGNFTCKHIPWYEGWHKKLDTDEWNFYRRNNISSSTVKMIMKINNDQHQKGLEIYNEIDKLINTLNDSHSKLLNNGFRINNDDSQEIKNNLEKSVEFLTKNKIKISELIEQNMTQ